MPGPVRTLNERLKWALWREDVAECGRVLAAGACVPAGACEQAEWLISAIKARADQAELLQLLLNEGCNPNSLYDRIGTDYQQTPFTTAAAHARLDILKILQAAGADIHWRSPTGANAASEAMPSRTRQIQRKDSPELAKVRAWLGQQGVHIDPLCSNSRRMLFWAGTNPCSWPDIPALLALGMDPAVLRWTPFIHRIASGEATVAEVTTLPVDEIERRDSYDRTPFLMAVSAGRKDLAEALLARGADMRATGWCETSAMHLAAEYDLPDFIEWLAGLGFPVDIPNKFQWMPLLKAASGALRAARKLLDLGADVNAPANGDQAILHAGSRGMLELLLDAGANVNAEWATSSPLKNACEADDAGLVQFLLERGANPNLGPGLGTALFSAVGADSLDCVRLLLDAGARVNALDGDGRTCLWRVRSVPMAQLLLERRANPGIRVPCGGGLAEDRIESVEVATLFKKARFEQKPGRTGK
jgi:ankyrin repeat protein